MNNHWTLFLMLIGIFFSCVPATIVQDLSLPALFGDHMVLQRNKNIVVWGWAEPGQEVAVHFRNQSVSVQAGKDTRWQIVLKPEDTGGPDSLVVRCGAEKHVYSDVLVGEVWLCSGQSNMEMPLTGFMPGDPIQDSENEIANANYPDLRMFTVKRDVSFEPRDNCSGQWQQCNPQSAGSFSATAYFFGRMLHKELKVPVGLIHSSWGGTPAEAWTDYQHLSKLADFDSALKNVKASSLQVKALDQWLDRLPKRVVDDSAEDKWSQIDFKDTHLAASGFTDKNWQTMELPTIWETSEIGQYDGVIWFRKKVDIPAELLSGKLMLELGPIDDMDITYFNGVKIGETQKEGYWKVNRVYEIPENLAQEKDNIIAVRVMDQQGGGGIYGEPGLMKIYAKNKPEEIISIAGIWKYLPIAEFRGGIFYLFDIDSRQFYQRPELPAALGPYTPTTLYNAMIHPLVPYTIQGAIWYQGESNAGNPKQYTYLFPAMITNWREVWGQGEFPFYYVQIAPYDYGEWTRSYELRDAQRKTLSLTNTGMAVTLDIGNPQNIHPADKQDVGKRLALWALAKTYGKDVVYSGPLYKSIETKGNKIILLFEHADGGLKAREKGLNHFLVAGADRVFKNAVAQIKGETVVVSSPQVNAPVAVRYLWDNTSAASLFNNAGLPASSFRTDDWDE